MHIHRRLPQFLLSALIAAVALLAAADVYAQDGAVMTPVPPLTGTTAVTTALPLTPTDPLAGLLTPIPAVPPIEYATSFAEVECPFIAPWNQEVICGEMEVPENRADPDSQGVSVFVAILKSLGRPEMDPVLVLPDGPGVDGVSLRRLIYGAPLRSNRDVILLDPRGTGYSTPSLNCTEVQGASSDPGEILAAYRTCYARLLEEGVDLSGYSSAAQVEDVVDLAQLLGIGSLNLYATGYGTRIAALLADKHPNLVRSMILEGVLPVAANPLLEEPLNLYNTVQRVAQDCTATPDCNAAFPALVARLLEVIDRYNAAPDRTGYGNGDDILALLVQRLAAGGDFLPAFVTALFDEDFTTACALLPPAGGCKLPTSAAEAIETARAACTGALQSAGLTWRSLLPSAADPTGADAETVAWLMGTLGFTLPAELFAHLDTRPFAEVAALLAEAPSADLDSLSEGAAATLYCAEDAPTFTLDDLRRVAARIPAQFGALPIEHAAVVKAICTFWKTPPLESSARIVQPILAPTLLVNGTHDAQTPPTWARRVAAGMEQARRRAFSRLRSRNSCRWERLPARHDAGVLGESRQ